MNQEYQRMIEEMQMSTQKWNQKKIEEQLASLALEQKSAQLQQEKFEKQLTAMALEQNAALLRQQTTLLDKVKTKPDYSNLKCFNCEKMCHSAKVCRQAKRPMTPAGDRNCFHCHQPGHFWRNCQIIVSKSSDGADHRPATNACKKVEYIKTREAYIELVKAGRTCSCLLDTGSDVTLFPHALVRGLPLDQCVVDLSAEMAPA